MDDFKGKISEEVLDSLTMEDLWNSPRLKKLVEEKYPRAYLSITYEKQSSTVNNAQTNLMILSTTLISAYISSIIDSYFFSGLK